MLSILNTYFRNDDRRGLIRGGEVVKFIGDGVLAVFPIAANRPH
jgi:class 3 adenylate cyclase